MNKIKVLFSLLIVGMVLTVSSLRAAEEIRLSGPASMSDAIKELINRFGASGPHSRVITNFGPSGAMAKQINEGAPADLFISANQKWMTFLREEHRIEPSSEKILAANTLVLVGKKNQEITSMRSIVKLRQIAIGSPKSVPAGEYAVQAMERAGVYKQLEAENRLVMAKDVRQALTYAVRGETEGAFVYRTDGLLATEAAILFEVPQDLYDRVTYPIALTVDGVKKPEARALYDFLTGPVGMEVFTHYGFSTAK